MGKVGTGFTEEMLGVLTDKFEKVKTDVAPFQPEAGDRVTWLKPELVCEVAYQVVTDDTKLRMARFHHLREDKSPAECTLDQIVENTKTGRTQTLDKLSEYASKRHFEETPEPKGAAEKRRLKN